MNFLWVVVVFFLTTKSFASVDLITAVNIRNPDLIKQTLLENWNSAIKDCVYTDRKGQLKPVDATFYQEAILHILKSKEESVVNIDQSGSQPIVNIQHAPKSLVLPWDLFFTTDSDLKCIQSIDIEVYKTEVNRTNTGTLLDPVYKYIESKVIVSKAKCNLSY